MTSKHRWAKMFYSLGVAMTFVCFALVLSGNTDLLWRFEHQGFPLSWAAAGLAILAFLGAELTSTGVPPAQAEVQISDLAPELEAVES